MMKKLKASRGTILSWAGIVIVLYIMTLLQAPMVISNLFLVITTSACLCLAWQKNSEVKWEVPVILLGLLARVAFCYLDVYAEFSLPIGGGDDGITFLKTAIEYCQGNFETQYTNYPYVLYGIFQITGINQFAAQYVNILCWGFAMIVLQKSCEKLDINGIFRLISIVVMAWLPTNIWITSILYRDTYVMLFLFLSFYFLFCWMQDGKWKNIIYSVVTVLLAAWLHGGSVAALIPIVITLVFFSREKKAFCMNKKNVLATLSLVGVAVVLISIPSIGNVLLKKIPSMENGLIEMLNGWLEAKYAYSSEAGSNYLVGRYLTGYFDLIPMTIQRIYYHTLSPAPNAWRGLTDAIAFFGSTAPIYLISAILWAVSIFYKKKDAYRFVILMESFITVGLYAWANVNAGAALRHREKIIGLVILMAVYSLNIILQGRKERKDIEKIANN